MRADCRKGSKGSSSRTTSQRFPPAYIRRTHKLEAICRVEHFGGFEMGELAKPEDSSVDGFEVRLLLDAAHTTVAQVCFVRGGVQEELIDVPADFEGQVQERDRLCTELCRRMI